MCFVFERGHFCFGPAGFAHFFEELLVHVEEHGGPDFFHATSNGAVDTRAEKKKRAEHNDTIVEQHGWPKEHLLLEKPTLAKVNAAACTKAGNNMRRTLRRGG